MGADMPDYLQRGAESCRSDKGAIRKGAPEKQQQNANA